jgi:hypothetical protein
VSKGVCDRDVIFFCVFCVFYEKDRWIVGTVLALWQSLIALTLSLSHVLSLSQGISGSQDADQSQDADRYVPSHAPSSIQPVRHWHLFAYALQVTYLSCATCGVTYACIMRCDFVRCVQERRLNLTLSRRIR